MNMIMLIPVVLLGSPLVMIWAMVTAGVSSK